MIGYGVVGDGGRHYHYQRQRIRLEAPSNARSIKKYKATSLDDAHFIIGALPYHAGLNNKLWTSVLDDWISAKTQVVVATMAFVEWLAFFFFLLPHYLKFNLVLASTSLLTSGSSF
uniref:Uncharacterized protein n=1 Tax=Lactuca sativa TaxID=4236 RepID=A0A9R1UQJ0_LACSA|nr:hypothetical protein LSAT_V11C800395110 [Lactuca sativa]